MIRKYISNFMSYPDVNMLLKDFIKHGLPISFTRETSPVDISSKTFGNHSRSVMMHEIRYLEYNKRYEPYVDIILEYYTKNSIELIRKIKTK